ncbi:M18 family aminopeptidase [Gulosibacter molinativorax]|uniref:M18 family aminopeptidase n=1 Tax=Gulosibacter molinativorax TaxID=256821 RepID=A0ABT7C7D8_9MICO|nr:M18 family aminopeptidase [Gulosibacter molinativorax]MDJ1371038.1 M18 family aminopeptidase [Gulosibacter molinativorax]QUY61398.1 M18 family aminopeptidase [Gulosibacter molinativorax]
MVSSETTFQQLAALVSASPTSYHAAREVAYQLTEAGFTELDEAQPWPHGPGSYVVVRDGAVIAWRIPEDVDALTPFGVVAGHTDSPGFRIKPVPETKRSGWQSLNAEVYGGPLLNSWLDRDLRVGARLILTDGSEALAVTGAVARIPQLAVHLDRKVNAEGLKLDAQQHTHAVLGLEDAPGILELLAQDAGVGAEEVRAFDAFFTDSQKPSRLGSNGELIASGRLDNLVSIHAGLRALIAAEPLGIIPVLAGFDHEEVGSSTRTGAGGPFLEDVLARIRESLGASVSEERRAASQSWVISSDVGHAVHPNYPERHDEDVRPIAGLGPIIKINADQRYVTDGAGEALWRQLSEDAGVPAQAFVSKNTMPCGSTVGPIMATRLGMRTVDVGIPILSMHSARELAVISDVSALQQVLTEFFSHAH